MDSIDIVIFVVLVGLAIGLAPRRTWDKKELRVAPHRGRLVAWGGTIRFWGSR